MEVSLLGGPYNLCQWRIDRKVKYIDVNYVPEKCEPIVLVTNFEEELKPLKISIARYVLIDDSDEDKLKYAYSGDIAS